VCAHVVAEHFYSFRVTRKEEDMEAEDTAASAPLAASGLVESAACVAGAPAVHAVVTHDYLMECVLCGKGADEQVHYPSGTRRSDISAAGGARASPAVAPPPPAATLTLGGLQLPAHAPRAAPMEAAEAEEWA
jgi:hypothetical protein